MPGEAEDFTGAQAGIEHELEHTAVALAGGIVATGRGEQGAGFVTGEDLGEAASHGVRAPFCENWRKATFSPVYRIPIGSCKARDAKTLVYRVTPCLASTRVHQPEKRPRTMAVFAFSPCHPTCEPFHSHKQNTAILVAHTRQASKRPHAYAEI